MGLAAAVAVGVAVVVVAATGATTPRAGMGHRALCKVPGQAAVPAVVADFPARFVTPLAWRGAEAAVDLATLALPA